MSSIRVSELAKELNLSWKEVLEKFAEISIVLKSHSNVVTPEQIRKLKEHLGIVPQKTVAKKATISGTAKKTATKKSPAKKTSKKATSKKES